MSLTAFSGPTVSADYTPPLVQIIEIPGSLGGGYEASIPILGAYGFVGDGDTREEALANLGQAIAEIIAEYLA